MAENKFHSIYIELVNRIKNKEYEHMLPTESVLTSEFKTSRSTIRRAIGLLNSEGYTYSVKGRGVVILESFEDEKWSFNAENFGGLEAINRFNSIHTETIVVRFRKIIVTKNEAIHLPFYEDEVLYEVERIRVLNNKKMILDHSFFKVDEVPALNQDIVEKSIYKHFKKEGMRIIAAKRRFLVEFATLNDKKNLDLKEYNCVGVLENLTFNDRGKLFEYTESRFVPGVLDLSYFVQNENI